MKYRVPKPPRRRVKGRLGRLVDVLSKVEPYLVQIVSSTPVFSDEEKEEIVERYGDLRDQCLEGSSREREVKGLNEVFEPEKELYGLDDTRLLVKLENTNEELQYIVSLGLHTIERLYLTDNLTEDLYFKYRRVLRFLPKFHEELVRRMESAESD